MVWWGIIIVCNKRGSNYYWSGLLCPPVALVRGLIDLVMGYVAPVMGYLVPVMRYGASVAPLMVLVPHPWQHF